jgi:hypothetical protein
VLLGVPNFVSEGVGQEFSIWEVLSVTNLIYVNEVKSGCGVTVVDIGHSTFGILANGVFYCGVVGIVLGATCEELTT